MCGTTVFGILRGLIVWLGALVWISLSIADPQGSGLVVMLLVMFYTIPALLLLLLLHLIETSLIRRDGAVLSLAIGPALAAMAYAAPAFLGEVLGPIGICWLMTAIIRLILLSMRLHRDARMRA
jgi:hypothetical protein